MKTMDEPETLFSWRRYFGKWQNSGCYPNIDPKKEVGKLIFYITKSIPRSQNVSVRGYSPNILPYLTFHANLRSSNLWVAPYSEYQTELHNTISDLRDRGLNFKQIADWLNENGYSTPRGKKFRNAHAHSIIKKKRIRDERLSRECQVAVYNFDLRFVDKTMVNSV